MARMKVKPICKVPWPKCTGYCIWMIQMRVSFRWKGCLDDSLTCRKCVSFCFTKFIAFKLLHSASIWSFCSSFHGGHPEDENLVPTKMTISKLQKCGEFTLFHFLSPHKKQLQVRDPISSRVFSQNCFPGQIQPDTIRIWTTSRNQRSRT